MRVSRIALVVGFAALAAVLIATRPDLERQARSGSAGGGRDALSVPDADADREANTQRESAVVRVTDATSGEPIQYAVVAVSAWSKGRGEESHRLRTNADGRCSFGLPYQAKFAVHARGYMPESYGCVAPRLVEIALRESAPELTVTVMNEFDELLPDAVASPRDAPEIVYRANANGRIRLHRSGWMNISAPAHLTSILRDDPVVVLSAAYSVSGRVVDSAGRPVAGARVSLGMTDSGEEIETTTDADGRFSQSGLSTGEQSISVSHGRFSTVQTSVWAGDSNVRILLYRPMFLTLDFVDSEDRPVWGVDYLLEGVGNAGGGVGLLGLKASAAILGPSEPGEYTLTASANELEFKWHIYIEEGDSQYLRAVLRKPPARSRILLRVLDPRGQPVVGWAIESRARYRDYAGVTGPKGMGILETWEPPGTVMKVEIMAPDTLRGTVAGRTLSVRTVTPRANSDPILVTLERPVVFELVVVCLDGSPVDPESVQIENPHAVPTGALRWLVPPDSKTNVELRYLRQVKDLPPGRHRIVLHPAQLITGRAIDETGRPIVVDRISAWGSRILSGFGTDGEGGFALELRRSGVERIYIGRGGEAEAERTIELRPDWDMNLGDVVLREPRRVTGRVVGRDGRPVSGAQIFAPKLGLWGPYSKRFVTSSSNTDGRFALRLSALVRHVTVRKSGYGTRLVPIEGLDKITLGVFGTLEIGWREAGHRLGWPQPDGKIVWGEQDYASALQLPPGRYQLQWWDESDNVLRRKVIIAAGETVRVGAK